ncbi:putative N-acetylglucosamine-6-phosphate deacetylase [Orchesella cincta]|uniref:N-acetylglucosamine-6-phosphate deacetylase n=1 Tax=Orchesella cincta TaxID=48709 RepID=A0A1D2N1F0_ORCCI|nr:putative N-acetylglucosamine-6-phosphate deacetylase [Orchesella cincta]
MPGKSDISCGYVHKPHNLTCGESCNEKGCQGNNDASQKVFVHPISDRVRKLSYSVTGYKIIRRKVEYVRPIVKFENCRILRGHDLIKDDFWISGPNIVDPEDLFFNLKMMPDKVIDCKGAIVAPGFIDVQINGGFGVDFAYDISRVEEAVVTVAKGVLAHGVTSFCPTLVSSMPEVYKEVLPFLKKRSGGKHGAEVLGAHVEGPFINEEKKGAHDPATMQTFAKGLESVRDVYKHLDAVCIITLAPELPNAVGVCRQLTDAGIIVSVGHSMASIAEGEEAVKNGAAFITHLFNAMLPFHHRDPGLVGLLASEKIPEGRTIYYGIIADGNHTHPATTRIAYRAYPKGIVLVTDACSAMGLSEGVYHIGQQVIEVTGTKAYVKGTTTLAGSVATMISCIHYFWKTTSCSIVEALEAATLHPALLLNIDDRKGTLDFGTDADFVLLDPTNLEVQSTWIAGERVYEKPVCKPEV